MYEALGSHEFLAVTNWEWAHLSHIETKSAEDQRSLSEMDLSDRPKSEPDRICSQALVYPRELTSYRRKRTGAMDGMAPYARKAQDNVGLGTGASGDRELIEEIANLDQ